MLLDDEELEYRRLLEEAGVDPSSIALDPDAEHALQVVGCEGLGGSREARLLGCCCGRCFVRAAALCLRAE